MNQMTPQELRSLKDGISRLLEIGATYDQIHGVLASRGWGEEDIALVLDPEAGADPKRMKALTNPLELFRRSIELSFSRFGNQFLILLFTCIISSVILFSAYLFLSSDGVERVFEVVHSGFTEPAIVTPLVVTGLFGLSFLLGGVLMIGPTALMNGLSGEKRSVSDNLGVGFARTYSLLAVILLMVVLIALGLVLFVIPGLIAGAWFFFAPMVTVREKASPLDALLISRELVRGRVLGIIARVVLLLLATALFFVVCLGLITPLSYIDSLGIVASLAIVTVVALALLSAMSVFALFALSFYGLLYRELRELRPRAYSPAQSGMIPIPVLLTLLAAISASVLMITPQADQFQELSSSEAPSGSSGEIVYANPIAYNAGELEFDNALVYVALAGTRTERMMGLSRQKDIGEDEGLLFNFEKSDRHGIWMKDMYFPIDIIWLDKDWKIVDIKEDARPESYKSVTNAETYYPQKNALYVLEVTAGFAKKFGLKEGDHARLKLFSRATP